MAKTKVIPPRDAPTVEPIIDLPAEQLAALREFLCSSGYQQHEPAALGSARQILHDAESTRVTPVYIV